MSVRTLVSFRALMQRLVSENMYLDKLSSTSVFAEP